MPPFKPAIHRQCFIDKKIRERTYPTTATLARDYLAEYGAKIDPHTFATDIACMRENLRAPIRFNRDKKGYEYADPAYEARLLREAEGDISIHHLGLAGLSALGFGPGVPHILPATAGLPPWQQEALRVVFDKLAPPGAGEGEGGKVDIDLGKIAVARGDAPDFLSPGVEEAVAAALSSSRALSLVRAPSAAVPGGGPGGGPGWVGEGAFLFHPFQLVYINDECFLFGACPGVPAGAAPGTGSPDAGSPDAGVAEAPPYALLPARSLARAELTEGAFTPPHRVRVHRVSPQGVEVMFSRPSADTILVFTKPAGASYTLLSRIDLYAA